MRTDSSLPSIIADHARQLASDRFVLLELEGLAGAAVQTLGPMFEDLEQDLADVHPDRLRARDVLDYAVADEGIYRLNEATSVTLIGMAEHPEPRTHKRVLLLQHALVRELAEVVLALLPSGDSPLQGEISFDLFRTFRTVVKARHRDAASYVAILVVAKHGGGAKTELSRDAMGHDIVFSRVLAPGEILLWEDSAFFHYTSPLEGKDSRRDAVIIAVT